MLILKSLIEQAGKIINKSFKFEAGSLKDPKVKEYLQNTLRIHQVLGLVNVDFKEVFSDKVDKKT